MVIITEVIDEFVEFKILSNYSEAALDWHHGTLGCRGTHFGKACARLHSADGGNLCRLIKLSSKSAFLFLFTHFFIHNPSVGSK